MIHTFPDRRWYVDEYLVPSMLEQGITKDEIEIHNDANKEGNLKSWIRCCTNIAAQNSEGNTWHMQDDILICRDFAKRTKEVGGSGVACGFASSYDKQRPGGPVPANDMWFSFACIRIPDPYMVPFLYWFNSVSKAWFENEAKENRNDDMFFREYVRARHPNTIVFNMTPNLVEHVDFLLGGSVVNPQRKKRNVSSIYWDDEELVIDLAKRLGQMEAYEKQKAKDEGVC